MNIIEELKQAFNSSHESKTKKSQLAKMLGRSPAVVTSILNGTRKLKAEELPIIYEFLGKDLTKRLVPVVGYVGGGYEIFAFDDAAAVGGLDYVDDLPGASEDAVAVVVRGDSMQPAFYDGDHIIYDERRTGSDIADLAGDECVVRLADGRMFVKVLVPGTDKGTWTLYSHNGPPIVNEVVEWAGRVGWVRRARRTGARIARG